QGKATFGTTWSLLRGMFDDPAKSKVVGQLHVMLYPGGKAGMTGTYDGSESLGIAADSKHADAAWKYIEFLTGKAMERQAVDQRENPAHLEEVPQRPGADQGRPSLAHDSGPAQAHHPAAWGRLVQRVFPNHAGRAAPSRHRQEEPQGGARWSGGRDGQSDEAP